MTPENSYHAIQIITEKHDLFLKHVCKKLNKLGENETELVTSTVVNSGSVVVERGENYNITVSLNKTDDSDHVISYPGKKVLFSINKNFRIERYKHDARLNKYIYQNGLLVGENSPVLIDGEDEAYTLSTEETTLIGSINFPFPSGEVNVFNKHTGDITFWFLSDESSARFLFILRALKDIGDENLLRVAKETIYHYHPAVQWASFKLINALSPQEIEDYRSLLFSSENEKLTELVSSSY